MCEREWQCVCEGRQRVSGRARRASGSVCQFSEVMNETGCLKKKEQFLYTRTAVNPCDVIYCMMCTFRVTIRPII